MRYIISASYPDKVALEEINPSDFGKLLYHCCEDILALSQNPDIEQIKEYVKQGKWNFLFDQEGHFIDNSMESI